MDRLKGNIISPKVSKALLALDGSQMQHSQKRLISQRQFKKA